MNYKLWIVIVILVASAILGSCGGRAKCQQYNPETDRYENVECPPELEDSESDWIIGPNHLEKQ
jgi:hypothetical protein